LILFGELIQGICHSFSMHGQTCPLGCDCWEQVFLGVLLSREGAPYRLTLRLDE